MNKAKYIIINSDEEYFAEILANNKIRFIKDIAQARIMDWEEGQELISYLEFKIGKTCILEAVKS